MQEQILLALIGFALGVASTVLTQSLSRRWKYADARRKRKVEELQRIREWMESYRDLFQCKYPQLGEIVLAHEVLRPDSPRYDETAPSRVHKALVEYRDAKARLDEAARAAYQALDSLKDPIWDRLGRINLSLSLLMWKWRFFNPGRYLFPVSLATTITPYLKEIDKYQYKVFKEFPDEAIQRLEWDKIDDVSPSDVETIIHPWLKYFVGKSDYKDREIHIFDAMHNLPYYRRQAERAIEEVLMEAHRREGEWITPDIG